MPKVARAGRSPKGPVSTANSVNGVNLEHNLSRLKVSDFSEEEKPAGPTEGIESEIEVVTTNTKPEKLCEIGRENDEGPVEYKWKLVQPTPERLIRLVTQLEYRLKEGGGEAIYELGVEDDGHLKGVTQEELEESIHTLERMADQLGAATTVIRTLEGVEKGSQVAEVLVRRKTSIPPEVRIGIVGNVDSGKSTLCGVLTKGLLDDGRGNMRSHMFNHAHEVASGRTSSIGKEIMGFDATGTPVNSGTFRTLPWSEVIARSSKLVTLVDLAGHERYLKTTVMGLSGQAPDYVGLIVGANMGVQRMTREHMRISLALEVPLFCVVTKLDMCPKDVRRATINNLGKILKGPQVGKIPFLVRSQADVMVSLKAMRGAGQRVVPVFPVSNVTGHNLDLLKSFLNLLQSSRSWEEASELEPEFHIDQTFQVPGIGLVLSGTMYSGSVQQGDELRLGPMGDGNFKSVIVKTIHTKRTPVTSVRAGLDACFAVKSLDVRKKLIREQVRRGMVMVADKEATASWEFEAEITVLQHPTTIRSNYAPVIHAHSIRQAARIVSMEKDTLRTGDKAKILFRFQFRAEYLTVGTTILFCEGMTKGVGKVVRVPRAGQ